MYRVSAGMKPSLARDSSGNVKLVDTRTQAGGGRGEDCNPCHGGGGGRGEWTAILAMAGEGERGMPCNTMAAGGRGGHPPTVRSSLIVASARLCSIMIPRGQEHRIHNCRRETRSQSSILQY